MPRSCIFCGGVGSLTREHVIPAWLQRQIDNGQEDAPKSMFSGTRINFLGEPQSKREIRGSKHTSKIVCAKCNNGWMSQLETRFASILPDLTAGMSLDEFTELERRTIATWIVKTGIMANWSANYRRILPDDFPRQLHREQAPPSHVSCFFGGRDLANSVGWCQGNLRFLRMRQTDYEISDTPTSSYIFVIGIMNILLAFSWHAYKSEFYTISQAGKKMREFYPELRAADELPTFNSEYEAYLLFQLHPKAAAT